MKTRIISALVALIILIPLIIIGNIPFAIGVIILGLIGFKELLDLKEKEKKLPILIKIISFLSFFAVLINSLPSLPDYFMDYSIFTIVIFLLLLPLVFYHDEKKYNINDALFLLGSVFFLGIAFNFLIHIRNIGIEYLIFLLLITIMTDTFAFVTGKLIGKHKLCPDISPNKTVEGAVGGSIMGTFVASMFYVTIFDPTMNIIVVVLLVLLLTVVGQLGDLVFSSIKRYYNIKDFGNIMPGHGGVLDRLDSILFVVLFVFSFLIGLL